MYLVFLTFDNFTDNQNILDNLNKCYILHIILKNLDILKNICQYMLLLQKFLINVMK